MAKLVDKTPCDGLLPLSAGHATLSEVAPEQITSVAPYPGKDRAVGSALKALGLGWPKPGVSISAEGALCLWSGRGQAFLIGPAPDGLEGAAALTDQSDAWARLRLEGADAEPVLARLVPLDLGRDRFVVGNVARTGLNHMATLLYRPAPDAFEIFVFRSMAASAVHELHATIRAVDARGAVG